MRLIFISITALLLALFQNCGNVKFDAASDRLASQGEFVSHTFARTKMNTPVEFAANGDRTFSNLSATAQSATPENGRGKDYFFGNGSFSWRSGNPYGDHDSRLHEILMAPDKSFVVPKDAVLPTVAQTATGVSTLAEYVGKELRGFSG